MNRPRERSLNPYVFFSDGYTLLKGNPELEPEYANLLELNYMMNYKLGFISLEAFYRQTDNKMSRYGELNTEGVLEYSWGNLDKDVSIGTELMINTEIAKWWSVNLNTSIFQYQLIGEYSDETVERTSTNMTARLMSNFKFKTNTSFQINGMYRSPSATIDGEREAMYFVSAGIKQDLFKRKLSVSLNVKDIFQTGKRVSTTETDTYNIYSEMYRQAPTATIKLSYKLNSYKGSKNRNKEASEYDMYIM